MHTRHSMYSMYWIQYVLDSYWIQHELDSNAIASQGVAQRLAPAKALASPWSPFSLRRAHPGPGPNTRRHVLGTNKTDKAAVLKSGIQPSVRRDVSGTHKIAIYRGTSLIRNSAPIGPYGRTILRVIWWSLGGGGLFLMSEVPLWGGVNMDLLKSVQVCGSL